jgi:hypothetical protein
MIFCALVLILDNLRFHAIKKLVNFGFIFFGSFKLFFKNMKDFSGIIFAAMMISTMLIASS